MCQACPPPLRAVVDRRAEFAGRVKGDKHAQRRVKRLTSHARGFLIWAASRLRAAGVDFAEDPLDGSLTIDELSGPRCAELCNALCADPVCCGQLQLAAAAKQSTNPVAPVALSRVLTDTCLDRPPHVVFDEGIPHGPSSVAPSYRGTRWRLRDGEVCTPWETLSGQISDHYAAEAVRKRNKCDGSPYSEHLVEALVAQSIERSHLHAWYAGLVSRSNKRHQTFNFLQEVAIVEHAHFLERMLNVGQRGPFPAFDAVIDFGGGNGMMAFAAGHRLQARHIVVDKYVPGFRTDDTCAADDPYFYRVHKDIRELVWQRDIVHPPSRCIAISKHLCGSGVDHLLHMFDRESSWPAAMALSSCCHHKCRHEEYVDPAYLRALGVHTQTQFDDVARRCGWLASEHLPWMQRVGATTEAMLDLGRVLWLRQRGYVAFSVTCMSTFLSPRNRMLVAWKAAGRLSR